MLAPESHLHLLSSEELITDIQYLLDKDEKIIHKKQEYYRQQYHNKSADQQQIKRIYDQIQEYETRHAFFTELYNRLQSSHALHILEAIDELKMEQLKINGNSLTDYKIYILRVNNVDRVFLQPLT